MNADRKRFAPAVEPANDLAPEVEAPWELYPEWRRQELARKYADYSEDCGFEESDESYHGVGSLFR